jgi:SAM-dependent methyltransferase
MTGEMIAKAKENIAAAGLTNVEVLKGLIEEMPVETASVDWVISNCVINLSPEKPRVFKEIARVLKPGGRISISDIVVKDLPDWARKSASLYSSCVAGAISEDEYLQGLRDAGLVDVEVSEWLVYDRSQLAAFIKSEIAPQGSVGGSCCGVDAIGTGAAMLIAEMMGGKVWSAKFKGRKG